MNAKTNTGDQAPIGRFVTEEGWSSTSAGSLGLHMVFLFQVHWDTHGVKVPLPI